MQYYSGDDAPVKMEELRADKYVNDWRPSEEDELPQKEYSQDQYDVEATKRPA